ncbi:hypothetical protein H9Q13_06905 [Pontibacter sp. JH31]|uniref:DUF3106 domain-containing protein n=1 Tax=Pontibacter aquaedesilientis TaxID=2766980 RepID=A0ABR7XF17_9BACT|nr:hypothetical protein [Pontibacter aquaedesilientis]MBD1396888.1 hypothetical protein [Pontibacter aquaedesilientis]
MKKIIKNAFALLLLVLAFGAQAQSQSKLEQDLQDLRTWMSRKASQGDSITRAEWPTIKQEFRARTQSLEQGTGKMTEQSKQEYSELKTRYRQWETDNEERYGQPLNRETASDWERKLAGTRNIDKLKSSQIRETYTRFMENVRGLRHDWSLRDWDYAEHVYLLLNDRKQQVLDQMSNSDKMKVAALQVEFNTLRKSRDAKDLYNSMREQR